MFFIKTSEDECVQTRMGDNCQFPKGLALPIGGHKLVPRANKRYVPTTLLLSCGSAGDTWPLIPDTERWSLMSVAANSMSGELGACRQLAYHLWVSMDQRALLYSDNFHHFILYPIKDYHVYGDLFGIVLRLMAGGFVPIHTTNLPILTLAALMLLKKKDVYGKKEHWKHSVS